MPFVQYRGNIVKQINSSIGAAHVDGFYSLIVQIIVYHDEALSSSPDIGFCYDLVNVLLWQVGLAVFGSYWNKLG